MTTRINSARWLENQQRWQIKVQRDGIRKTFTSSVKGRRGQRIANQKADEWLASVSLNPDASVQQMVRMFLEQKEKQGATAHSVKCFASFFNSWILPRLASKPIRKVTLYQWQSTIDERFKNAQATKSTLQAHKTLVVALCRFAKSYGVDTVDASLLRIPKNAKAVDRQSFTLDECNTILTDASVRRYNVEVADPYIDIYRMLLLTGMRRGECLALKWSDLKDGCIQVRRALTIDGSLNEGKTVNARRLIPITSQIQEILDRTPRRSRYIFNTDDLSIRSGTVSKCFKRYCEQHRFSTTNLHSLRHTFVSLSDSVLPLNTVKAIIGHSEAMDTVGWYGHIFGDEMDDARQVLEDTFEQIEKKSLDVSDSSSHS